MVEKIAPIIKVGSMLMVAVASVSFAHAYSRSIDQGYPGKTFSVDGTADIDTVPDVAMFSATVMTEGDQDVVALQSGNAEKMNRVNQYLKESGVEGKDLKTRQYNLVPRYNNVVCTSGICPPASIIGYTLTQTLEVKVRDTAKIGELLSGVVKQGANTVSDVQFIVDDDTKAKNQARSEAIAKAKAKAESIAKAAGFGLGKLVSVYEMSDAPQPYALGVGGAADGAGMKSAVPPSIEPGTSATSVTVNLTYEIKNRH